MEAPSSLSFYHSASLLTRPQGDQQAQRCPLNMTFDLEILSSLGLLTRAVIILKLKDTFGVTHSPAARRGPESCPEHMRSTGRRPSALHRGLPLQIIKPSLLNLCLASNFHPRDHPTPSQLTVPSATWPFLNNLQCSFAHWVRALPPP